MPNILPLLYLALACFWPNPLSSCSCDSVPSFLENIDRGTLILQVQVLGHGALPVKEIRQFLAAKYLQEEYPTPRGIPPRPLPPYPYHSYTVLQVTDPIMGASSIGDTIVFFNGAGAICLGSLEHRAPGMKYVLKVHESNEEVLGEDFKEWLRTEGWMDKSWDNRSIFSSGICHEWLLEMEDQVASGRITKNDRQDYIRELRKDSLSLAEQQNLLGQIQRMGRESMPYMELAGSIREIERGLSRKQAGWDFCEDWLNAIILPNWKESEKGQLFMGDTIRCFIGTKQYWERAILANQFCLRGESREWIESVFGLPTEGRYLTSGQYRAKYSICDGGRYGPQWHILIDYDENHRVARIDEAVTFY